MNINLRNYLNYETIERLSKYIGDPNVLVNNKSIYTAIVWSPDERSQQFQNISKNYIIKMNPKTPLFLDDKFFYMWIRNSVRCIFGTGQMTRDIEYWPSGRINFGEYQDIDQYTRTFGCQSEQQQINYIISKTLKNQEILNLKYYKKAHIQKNIYKCPTLDLEDQELQAFMKQNFITILPPVLTVRQAYLKTIDLEHKYPILNDLGPQHIQECLDLIDCMVITIYRGGLDTEFIGGEMPNISNILLEFDVIFESEEFQQHEGHIRFYVLKKKY